LVTKPIIVVLVVVNTTIIVTTAVIFVSTAVIFVITNVGIAVVADTAVTTAVTTFAAFAIIIVTTAVIFVITAVIFVIAIVGIAVVAVAAVTIAVVAVITVRCLAATYVKCYHVRQQDASASACSSTTPPGARHRPCTRYPVAPLPPVPPTRVRTRPPGIGVC
jgi:hypothetical protein